MRIHIENIVYFVCHHEAPTNNRRMIEFSIPKRSAPKKIKLNVSVFVRVFVVKTKQHTRKTKFVEEKWI